MRSPIASACGGYCCTCTLRAPQTGRVVFLQRPFEANRHATKSESETRQHDTQKNSTLFCRKRKGPTNQTHPKKHKQPTMPPKKKGGKKKKASSKKKKDSSALSELDEVKRAQLEAQLLRTSLGWVLTLFSTTRLFVCLFVC